MSNVELVRQAYHDFAAGNIEAVMAIMHPEIEWRQSKGLPFIAGDGVFVGPQAVVENVFAPIPDHYEGFHIDIQ